jgi:hypothetical protein
MTLNDLPLPEREAGIARKHRSVGRTVTTAGILVAMITATAAWWWLLATFTQWLVLAVIDVFV